MGYPTKELFQLQVELVDAKVDMAVSNSINRVLDRIDNLQKDMDTRFSSLDNRLIAVETKLGMSSETQGLIRAKVIEYAFKTGWIILASVTAFVLARLHAFI